MGGKERLSFPQFVTAIARIAEEMTVKENPVASMSERLDYLCRHLERIVASKKNWHTVQKFSERLRSINILGKIKGGTGSSGSKSNTGTKKKHHRSGKK